MNHAANTVDATISEILEPLPREQVVKRLEDWRQRVHQLYQQIEVELDGEFTFDRAGKQRSMEEPVQHAGLTELEIPALDILRIERPNGQTKGLLVPRALWVVGANGRIDLTVFRGPKAVRRTFILYDLSVPFSGKSDWRLVSPTDSLHQPPLSLARLKELLFD